VTFEYRHEAALLKYRAPCGVLALRSALIEMTHTYEALTDEQLSAIGTQLKPRIDHASWFKLGTSILTVVAVAAIWHFEIAPDEKSPNSLMVQPATELLSSFVQPAPDLQWLSHDLGFKVNVPDLQRLGGEMTTYGESVFCGQPAAVVEYKKGFSDILLYSFSQNSKLLDGMRRVDSGRQHFYVSSGGAVSVVVWEGKTSGFHALAAKLTENDLLALAEDVARI